MSNPIPTLDVRTLARGAVVVALRLLDKGTCNVIPGAIGVVFEPAGHYEKEPTSPPLSGAPSMAAWGPMVAWPGYGWCNVYPGDVGSPEVDHYALANSVVDSAFGAALTSMLDKNEVARAADDANVLHRLERFFTANKARTEQQRTALKLLHDNKRRALPSERAAITHRFDISGHEGYLTVGLYPDGTPGELFIVMAKEGSTISGLMDTVAILISIGLQQGVPLDLIVRKLKGAKYEPAGWTQHSSIKQAHSITDYIARWLELKFLPPPSDAQHDPFDAGKPIAEKDPQPKVSDE